MVPPLKEEILVIGEIIRLKMHKDPGLIKDRRYHLRNYSCCFVGRDLVQWLVKNGEALNVANAVNCIRMLQENGILHHVCDDHLFKNEYLFYRFRIDDGTFFVDTQFETYHQAIMIHQRIIGDSKNAIMEDRVFNDRNESDDEEQLVNCFVASEFISWLILNDVIHDRYAGLIMGQQFLDISVIKPVGYEYSEFFDDDTPYRFIFDLECLTHLYKMLNITDDFDDNKRKAVLPTSKSTLLKKLWKGITDDEVVEPIPPKITDNNDNTDDEIPRLKPVVLREVSVAELMNKESPYFWKNIRITSDSVGFGFVIRGNGPCYVQAIDPSGPAASAGLKVRMYIYSVNGKKVLEMSHQEVAEVISQGVVVDMVALQHFRSSN